MNPIKNGLPMSSLLADTRTWPPSATYSLALWLIDLDSGTRQEPQLIYGWAIPTSKPQASKWTYRSNDDDRINLQDGMIRGRLRGLAISLTLERLLCLTDQLYKGAPLKDACTSIGLPEPTKGSLLRLGASQDDIATKYEILPPHIQPSHQALTLCAEWPRGLASPINDVPAQCASIYLVNKSSITNSLGINKPKDTESLFRTLLNHLSVETGLKFTSSDSGRIGNIDIFAFPSAGAFDDPIVKFHLRRTPACVELEIQNSDPGATFLVRCRTCIGAIIATDDCREFAGGTSASLIFPAPPTANFVLVTVWIRHTKDEDWHLWYEDGQLYLDGVAVNGALVGMEVNLQSDWLEPHLRSRVASRARQMQTVRPIQESVPIEISVGANWLKADRAMQELARKLFPPRSTGGFFINGWDSEGPGLLSFFEWFRRLVSSSAQGTLILIDPYFGTRGLELLIRAAQPHVSMIVLTNSQMISKDDIPPPSDNNLQIPKRALALLDECARLEPLIRRSRLIIKDMRRKGDRQVEVFHDRYVLLLDTTSQPRSGFHLSNSIQGATRHSPLLVTPMPEDLLPSVAGYVQSLLDANPKVVNKAECITLFDSSSLSRRPPPAHEVDIAPFIRIAMSAPALPSSTDGKFFDWLSEHSLVTGRPPDYCFETPESLYAGLARFATAIERPMLSAEEFAAEWSSFTAYLWRTSNAQDLLKSLIGSSGQLLTDRLRAFLLMAPTLPLPVGTSGVQSDAELLQIPSALRGDFVWQMSNLQHMHLPRASHGSHGVFYAARALAWSSPHTSGETIKELAQCLPPQSQADDLGELSTAVFSTISAILSALFETLFAARKVPSSLLESSLPVIRALSVQMIALSFKNGETDFANALQQITPLSLQEQREVLAAWATKIKENPSGTTLNFSPIRLALMKALQERWSPDMNQAEVHRLIARLGGTRLGVKAEALDSELLKPLEQQSKQESDNSLQLWSAILLEYLVLPTESQAREMSAQTHPPTDSIVGLTRACAAAFVRSSSEAQHRCLKEWGQCVTKSLWKIRSPFSRSRDSWMWFNATEALLRAQALLGQVLLTWHRNVVGTAPQLLVDLYNESMFEMPHHLLNEREELERLFEVLAEIRTELEALPPAS